jgi:hypothetical protein
VPAVRNTSSTLSSATLPTRWTWSGMGAAMVPPEVF